MYVLASWDAEIVCEELIDSFGPCWYFSLMKFKAGKFMYVKHSFCQAFFDQHLTEVQVNTFHSLNA